MRIQWPSLEQQASVDDVVYVRLSVVVVGERIIQQWQRWSSRASRWGRAPKQILFLRLKFPFNHVRCALRPRFPFAQLGKQARMDFLQPAPLVGTTAIYTYYVHPERMESKLEGRTTLQGGKQISAGYCRCKCKETPRNTHAVLKLLPSMNFFEEYEIEEGRTVD